MRRAEEERARSMSSIVRIFVLKKSWKISVVWSLSLLKLSPSISSTVRIFIIFQPINSDRIVWSNFFWDVSVKKSLYCLIIVLVNVLWYMQGIARIDSCFCLLMTKNVDGCLSCMRIPHKPINNSAAHDSPLFRWLYVSLTATRFLWVSGSSNLMYQIVLYHAVIYGCMFTWPWFCCRLGSRCSSWTQSITLWWKLLD